MAPHLMLAMANPKRTSAQHRAVGKSELLRIGELRPRRKGPRVLRLTHPKADGVIRPERIEQAAVFTWANHASRQWPALRLLFAVPNGGHRDPVTASLLKSTGTRAGIPDFLLPVARAGFIGFANEMKVKGRKVTDLQAAWLDALAAEGWQCHVSYSATEAIEALQKYVSAEPTLFGKAFADMSVPF